MAEKKEKPTGDTIQLVNFRLRNEEFGLDVSSIREITRITNISHVPEAPFFLRGVMNLRGKIIAVIDLSKLFGFASQEDLPKSARIIVAELKNQTVGILVDDVQEVLKIPEENIEPAPELIGSEVKKDYIRGVGKLENRLILLLDLEKIMTPHEMEEVANVK